mgnify:FL=1|jgi:hypothetical protein
MVATATALLSKLERLVGQRFDYLGEAWVLVEVLGDIDSLVLQRCSSRGGRTVQRNSYGQPTRRVDDVLTLPLTDAATGGYSPDVLGLLAGRQKDASSALAR